MKTHILLLGQAVFCPQRVEVADPLVEQPGVQNDVAEPSSSSRSREPRSRVPEPEQDSLENALQIAPVAKYGHFSFSIKKPHSSPPFGGLEVTCRYHKKSQVTGCKRFLRFTSGSEECRKNTILLLKHWSNCATRFERQRDHIRMPLSLSDLPAEAIVAAQALRGEPPSNVKTDEDLDAEAEARKKEKVTWKKSAKKEKNPKAPKSKAKAKPKARGQGKSKAKAKSCPQAASDTKCSDQESTGSDSSSSSSTSTSSSSTGSDSD